MSPLDPKYAKITTPLKPEVWEEGLPDCQCAEYLVRGISERVRLGFDYKNHKCRSARENMQSAVVNPGVVEEYLERERSLDRIVSPVDPKKTEVQVSSFGVIPKGHQIGKWRLILARLVSPGGSECK